MHLTLRETNMRERYVSICCIFKIHRMKIAMVKRLRRRVIILKEQSLKN